MTNFIENPESVLIELCQIEAATSGVEAALKYLNARQKILENQLNELTRPSVSPPPKKPTLIHCGFEYRGKIERRWYCIEVHLDLLKKLWADFPEKRDDMAAAMRSYGTSRTYVATTPEGLFLNKHTNWARQHCRRLTDGWYADSNINVERMRRIIPAAVRAAGLQWGKDVRAFWRPTHI